MDDYKKITECVKKTEEFMSGPMAFYDPKIIQHLTAKLVKLSCQGTIIGSNSKNVRKYYWAGAVPGFVLSWLALPRRTTVSSRLTMSIGAAQLGGTLTQNKLLEPHISRHESIVELDKAQDNILSDVVIKEYHDDPRTRLIISKYLYAEKVLDDSSTDQAEVKWRCRYFSGDDSVYSVDFLGAGEPKSNETEEIHRDTSLDEVADPSDDVFGI